MYYLEFDEMLPTTIGMYQESPVYRELMIEALESGKPVNGYDLERKMDVLGIKCDLIEDVDDRQSN